MVMMTDSRSKQGARLRAAVDRLHTAQLAALEAPVAPADSPAARQDAYGAECRVLSHLAEVGSLLVRLGGSAQVDAESAAMRRRVATLAVACANILAELVSLAFDVECAEVNLRELGGGLRPGAGRDGEAAAAAVAAGAAGGAGGGAGRGS